MMPAATHFDPVIGIDVHIVQPPGPVPPVPVPHPYVGIVWDPFDYVPIIGSTILVNGVHRAIAGTAGKAVPPHIPIGGVFVKPPANEDENFMGSATVEMDGDAAAYMALPCLSCQCIGSIPPPRLNPKKKTKVKSLVLPTSVVLPVPKGPLVLIGGPPTISLMNLAMHGVMAGLGKGLKRLARTNVARRGAAAFKRARQRMFRNMNPGFIKCQVLRAEPVDVVTGEVVVDQDDFDLPGRIPIRWTRHYRSGSERMGACGYGWETPADARLVLGENGDVIFQDGTGVAAYFDALPDHAPVQEPVDGGLLLRTEGHYAVRLKSGLTYYFPVPRAPEPEILVAAIVDACHNSLHFIRDQHGLKEVVESAGRRLEVTSRYGLIQAIRLRHPDFPEPQPLVRYAYDGEGDLAAVYDALDAPYRFAYTNHRLVRHTNRNGLSFYYEYDEATADGRVLHTWGDGGLYDYRFAYDPARRWTELTDSLGHPWSVEYDERLMITRETDPLGGTTNYTYDEAGRTTSVVDPAGRTTLYGYDDRGNLVELTRPDGAKIVTRYDGFGNPVEHIDPKGFVWRMAWDKRGLLAKRISPRAGVWSYTHDSLGDLIGVADPFGVLTTFQHDRYGNATTAIDGLGNQERFTFDALGNLSLYLDGEGCETRYTYDVKGRLTGVRFPSGARNSYTYDGEGSLTTFVDASGSITRYTYFGLGELAERRQADGTLVRSEYDTEERLTAVINERGQIFRLVRDAIGRIREEIDYWGNRKTYAYDLAGNIVEATDALGRTMRFAYDALDRLVHRRFADGTAESFGYDPNGNLILAENPSIRVERTYDEDGNLLEERQGKVCIQNEYDLAGNRALRRSGHGNELQLVHDPVGRVKEMHFNGNLLAAMTYDRRGLLSSERLGRKLERAFRHDADGNVVRQRLMVGSEAIVTRAYRYDAVGQLLARQDRRAGAESSAAFNYDLMGRITHWNDPAARAKSYDYDPHGMLLHETGSTGGDTRETVFNGCRYIFDAAGNLVRRIRPDGEAHFEWDQMNRLMAVRNERNQVVRFEYDALGRRTGKEVEGRRTNFVWDGDYLLSDTMSGAFTAASDENRDQADAANRAREFVFRPDSFEPIAFANDRVRYVDTDISGLPHDVLEENGQVAWTRSYNPFGKSLGDAESEPVICPLRLQGQYFDEETDLAYNRHRYYDGNVNAFISADPFGLEAGHNLYWYAPNIWLWVDPLGLRCRLTGPAVAKKARWVKARQGVEGPGLRGHFGKHGDQVGARTAKEYDQSARRTIQNGRRFTYRDRSSGERRVGYWDPETGFFTATSQTRKTPTIMTHFPETWENLRRLPGFSAS